MKKEQNIMRIGIAFQYFSSWQGGIDFCLNFLRALSLYADGNETIKIYCFIPSDINEISLKEIKKKIELIIDTRKNSPKSKIIYCNKKKF